MSLFFRRSFAVLSLALMVGACAERTGGRADVAKVAPPEPSAAATRPNFAQALAQAQAEARAPMAVAPPASLGAMPASRGLSAPEFYPGGGTARPVPPGTAAGREAPAGDIDLNFVNAEVREVVDAVLGEILDLGYAVDPSVQGTVTLRSTEPLAREDVLPALESVLSLNGLALVRDGRFVRIAPLERTNALAGAVAPMPAGAVAAGFGTYVMPLDHADAEELRTTLQPFVPQNRLLVADRSRGLLLFTGTGAEARTLSDLVGALDVNLLAGKSFALIPLQRAAPEEVADELDAVFASGATGGQAGVDGIVRFVPVDRLNAILVIAPNPVQVREAQTWIGRLDRGDSGSDRRLFVYRVQNGRAVDLAGTLDLLFGGQGRPRPRDEFELAPGLEPLDLGGIEPEAGVPDAGAPGREGLTGARRFGADRRRRGAAFPGSAAADIEVGDGSVIRVVGEESTNAVLVYATPGEYRMIEETLRQLDVTPPQVLIEATIAEVTLRDELRYGLQWFLDWGNNSFRFSTLEDGGLSAAVPGFTYFYSGADARVVLNALSSITDVKIVSAPQLLVRNNESARLQVGDEVPVVTQSAVSVVDPDAPLVNSIEYRQTGVILEVTPRVNASGVVLLDIVQEVSDVVPTRTSTLNSPTIQQRQIESSVVVQSGEPVALGGLIRDQATNGVSGVPVLSGIPVLGNLFKTTTTETGRTELLVLITPRVVNTQLDARIATEELRRRLRGLDALEDRLP